METTPQVLARLIHHGGRILVVGGGIIDHLGKKYQDHPAIILWDDTKQGNLQKEIPDNVRGVIYNRWISHAMAARLGDTCRRRHLLKFPMQKTQQIKSLLADIVQEERDLPVEVPLPADFDQRIEHLRKEQEEQEMEEQKAGPRQKLGHGVLVGFVAKNLDLATDWRIKGSITREAERLLAKAAAEGVTTTKMSVAQSISKVLKDMRKTTSYTGPTQRRMVRTTRKVAPRAAATRATAGSSEDDFVELGKLIEDAIAAMKLVQEHLPKVQVKMQVETERLRGLRQKMLDMLGE